MMQMLCDREIQGMSVSFHFQTEFFGRSKAGDPPPTPPSSENLKKLEGKHVVVIGLSMEI